MRAMLLLKDAKISLDMLEKEDDENRFRIIWLASIVILRSIGHVLAKVDADSDPKHKDVIEAWWKSIHDKKDGENAIFHKFIESERNSIVKEYEINFQDNAQLTFGLFDQADMSNTVGMEEFQNLYHPVMDGPYSGEDVRDVLGEAISWWEKQLCIIEASIRASGTTTL
ncbi:MAG: hypothetical protein GX849_08715 [Clostridiaceae bacterium]|jgi:hypothetical protein|nr:hypothetical protein [Clostridiaceae bacterium]